MDLFENSESVHKLNNFWEQSKVEISNIKTDQMTFKSQDLPLARIKKIMKLDEDVKSMMISAEAPILFAKAAEFFIREITLRAWIHTERNKRRTLQRSDITLAVADGDTDQFDFLIDIVPRDEIKTHGSTKREETTHSQPMHQVGGNISLFGGNTIHLTAPGMSSNQQTLITGLVDSSNMLQAQASQNNVQNQPQVQYVLQLPGGGSLGGGQTIQIQMVPQQTLISTGGGGDNTVNTMTTSGSVMNGQQQHMFTLSNSQTNHGTATVVLQPSMLTAGGQNQLYATTSSSAVALEQHHVAVSNIGQQVSTVSTSTTDGCGQSAVNSGQYVMSVVKRDMDEVNTSGTQDVI